MTLRRFNHDETPSISDANLLRRTAEVQMRRITMSRRGLKLAAWTTGDPAGKVILFLHGFLDCGRSWTDVCAQLGDGYHAICPDMRGFGASEWVGAGGYYHFYDYYDDVLSWLRHTGVASFSVVGHSMGGAIATGVAAIVGQRCENVVLLEGMGPPANEPENSTARLQVWTAALGREKTAGDVTHRRSQRRVLPGVAAAAARLRKYNPRLSEEQSVTMAGYLTEEVPDGVAFVHDPLHMTPAAKPFWIAEAQAMWRAIQAPVLLLSGAESTMPTQDLEGRVSHLRNARSMVVPAAGHNIHHDVPTVVAEAVRSWIERTPGTMPDVLVDGFPTAGRPATQ